MQASITKRHESDRLRPTGSTGRPSSPTKFSTPSVQDGVSGRGRKKPLVTHRQLTFHPMEQLGKGLRTPLKSTYESDVLAFELFLSWSISVSYWKGRDMATLFRPADKLPHDETVEKTCRCIEPMTLWTGPDTQLLTIMNIWQPGLVCSHRYQQAILHFGKAVKIAMARGAFCIADTKILFGCRWSAVLWSTTDQEWILRSQWNRDHLARVSEEKLDVAFSRGIAAWAGHHGNGVVVCAHVRLCRQPMEPSSSCEVVPVH